MALSRSEFRKRLVRFDYTKRQAEHHQKRSFEQESLVFLKKHAIDYDPKYVWG
jgi:hypothetical protein